MLWRQSLADGGHNGAGSAPSRVRWGGDASHDRGIALIITLLLLFLLSAIGLAAVLSAGSDLLINGYYGNYRGSFYAADSGINVARQAMYNQLNASFNSNFATFQTPPPAPISSLCILADPCALRYQRLGRDRGELHCQKLRWWRPLSY